MWIDRLRQFLDRSMQRFTAWLHGIERIPTRLFHSDAIEHGLPKLEGFESGSVKYSINPQTGRWYADLSYHYRSLTCQMQVSELEPPSGMRHLFTALQGADKG